MLAAIEFNDQPTVVADKINDIASNRRLPPKAQPVESVRAKGKP